MEEVFFAFVCLCLALRALAMLAFGTSMPLAWTVVFLFSTGSMLALALITVSDKL